ncbi:hypothetical protein Xenpb_03291 [Xenorhabdus sp. PB62.4]|nr:hypothetical protein [Xenorhabdus sp. PB62.4]
MMGMGDIEEVQVNILRLPPEDISHINFQVPW